MLWNIAIMAGCGFSHPILVGAVGNGLVGREGDSIPCTSTCRLFHETALNLGTVCSQDGMGR